MLIAVTSLSFVSCEKEVLPTRMQQFYDESTGLSEVSIDSIKSFTNKFSGYVGSYPESRQDKLFDPTVNNISSAAALHSYKLVEVKIGILVNPDWEDEIIVQF